MKFVLRYRVYDYGDSWFTEFKDKDSKPPLEDAVLESYVYVHTTHPQVTIEYKHEARLDEEGKPYIYSWKENNYEPSWEEWCAEGTNHSKREDNITRTFPSYEFFRDEVHYRWVVEINNLAVLEKLFKCGWSIDNSWRYDETFYLDFEEQDE